MNPSFRVHAVETDRGVRARTLRSVWRALARVGVHLIDVRVTLSDVNGPRGGLDKVCRVRVTLPGRRQVVVEERQRSFAAAADVAADRAAVAVVRALAARRALSSTRGG